MTDILEGIPTWILSDGTVKMEMYSTGMPPEMPKKPNGEMDEEAVLRMFDQKVTDADIHGEKRKPLDAKPIEQKWAYIKMQSALEATIPAPEYLIKLLKAHAIVLNGNKEKLSTLLEKVGVQLKSSAISWSSRFFSANGHLVLLNILARKVACFEGYDQPTKEDADSLVLAVTCFRNICDSKSGYQLMLKYPSCFSLFVRSLYPGLDRTAENVFQILLVLILKESDPTKADRNIKNTLEAFKTLKRGHHGWKIVTEFLKRNTGTANNTLNSIVLFIISLNQILLSQPSYSSYRTDWLLSIADAGLITTLHEVNKDYFPSLPEIIQSMEDELKYIKGIFPSKIINPYNQKSVVKQLYNMSDPTFVIPSILLSLIDTGLRSPQLFKYVTTFIHNFMMIVRGQTSGNNNQKLMQAIAIAQDLKVPIKLRNLNPEYEPNDLFQMCMFQPSDEMSQQPIMELVAEAGEAGGQKPKTPAGNEQDSSVPQVSSSNSSELQRIIQEYENKLKQANSQIEGLRYTVKNSVQKKEQESKKAEEFEKKAIESEKKAKAFEAKNKEIFDVANAYKQQAEQFKVGIEAYKEQAEKCLTELRSQVITLTNEKNALTSKYTALEQLVGKDGDAKISPEDIAKLTEVNELKKQTEEKDQEISKLKKEIDTLKEEVEKVKKDLQEALLHPVATGAPAPGAGVPPPPPGANIPPPPPPPPGANIPPPPPPPPGVNIPPPPPPPPGVNIPPPPPPPPGVNIPPPPPPPPGANIPPPPPPPPGAGIPPPPPPPPGAGIPPPPPPPPGAGIPPPPPPPPGMPRPPGAPPPPPPPPGMPRPPGAPPPPPPPGMPRPPGAPPAPNIPMGPPKKPNNPPPKKLKAIFWNKIPDAQSVNLIWKDIDESKVSFNKESLLELFQAAEVKKTVEVKKGPEKPKLVELIEPQRAKSISIMLGRFRKKVTEIAAMVKNLDESITIDNITALKSNVPTPDEIGAVEAYDGDPNLLGQPELFVQAVSKVQMYQQHVDFIDLKMTFDELMSDVETPLEILSSGFKQLKESKQFKEFLKYILAVGNFVNGGSNRGGAYGFKFDFFKKILDIRTNKPGYNLTNFIADDFDVEKLAAELDVLPKMLTVDFDTAKQNFTKLDGAMKKISNQVERAEKLVADGYMLAPEIMKFKDANASRLEKPPGLIKQIEEDYAKLVTQFGEEVAKTKMPEFIEVFVNLVNALKNAKENNIKLIEEEKKAEERAKKLAARQSAKGAKGPATSVPQASESQQEGAGERGVIDDLMNKLKKGGGVPLRKPSVLVGARQQMPAMPQMSELQRRMAERLAKSGGN